MDGLFPYPSPNRPGSPGKPFVKKATGTTGTEIPFYGIAAPYHIARVAIARLRASQSPDCGCRNRPIAGVAIARVRVPQSFERRRLRWQEFEMLIINEMIKNRILLLLPRQIIGK
jgi:hypothetical protein